MASHDSSIPTPELKGLLRTLPAMKIDFNADIAEGCPNDAALMQHVQSVNIACAAHAGSPASMVSALREAKSRGLRVGAHPGYFDREHFGRTERQITPDDLFYVVIYQLAALHALAEEVGISVSYLKPHGAMYHQAARDPQLARSLVRAARLFHCAVMGQPGTEVERACQSAGVQYWKEGFADRRYLPDGALVPRTQPDAMLQDPRAAARQVLWLVNTVKVDSICVHGDEPKAVDFIRDVQQHLATQEPR